MSTAALDDLDGFGLWFGLCALLALEDSGALSGRAAFFRLRRFHPSAFAEG
jgi:hypothetical protein